MFRGQDSVNSNSPEKDNQSSGEESNKKGKGVLHAFRKKTGKAADAVASVFSEKKDMYELTEEEKAHAAALKETREKEAEQKKQAEDRTKKLLKGAIGESKEKEKERKKTEKEQKKKEKQEKTEATLSTSSSSSSLTESSGLNADSSNSSGPSTSEKKLAFDVPPPAYVPPPPQIAKESFVSVPPPDDVPLPPAPVIKTVTSAPSNAFLNAIQSKATEVKLNDNKELLELREKVKGLEKEKADLKEQLQDVKDEFSKNQQNAENAIKELVTTNLELSNQNKYLQSKQANLEKMINAVQEEAAQMGRETLELGNDLRANNETLKIKEGELANANAQILQLKETINSLNAQILDLQGQLQDQVSENKKNQASVEAYKQKVEAEQKKQQDQIDALENAPVKGNIELLAEKITALEANAKDEPSKHFAAVLRAQYDLINENKDDNEVIALCVRTNELIDAFEAGDKKVALETYEKQCGVLSLPQKILRGVAAVLIAGVGVIVGAVIGIGVGAILGSIGGPGGGAVGALLGMFQGAVSGLGIGLTVAAAATGVVFGAAAGVGFFKPSKLSKSTEDVVRASNEIVNQPKLLDIY